MSHPAIFLTWCLFAAMAADRQDVAREMERRTGHGLAPPPAKKGALPPGVSLGAALSQSDAVAIALWNNAALQADLARLGLAQADLYEAGLLRNPNLSLLLPVGPKPFELALTAPVEVLWQRPRRVAAARLSVDVVTQTLVQHGLDLARDVKVAHAALTLAEERTAILGEAATLLETLAQLTQKRVDAGDAGAIDASLAQLDAAGAKDQAARAAGQAEIAREQLRALLGVRLEMKQLKTVPADVGKDPPLKSEDLVEQALSARPDLRAAELSVKAAAKRAGWERSRIASLGLILSSKGVGTHGIRSGPGLAADIPVFQRNQGAVRRAEADVERASLEYLALRERVELDVRESRQRLTTAHESFDRVRSLILPDTRQAIKLAELAYSAGDTSYLTMLEARRRIHSALLAEAEAAAEVRKAAAELERSVGTKP